MLIEINSIIGCKGKRYKIKMKMEERNSDHFFHFHFFALRIRLFTIILHLTKHISYYTLKIILCISKEQ